MKELRSLEQVDKEGLREFMKKGRMRFIKEHYVSTHSYRQHLNIFLMSQVLDMRNLEKKKSW